MSRLSRIVLTFALAAIIATPLIAQEKKKGNKKKKRGRRAFIAVRLPKSITLSDEQKTKYDAIIKEYSPKFLAVFQEQAKVLTPEQRKARGDAFKAAREAGKNRKETQAAVTAAVKMTDEQTKQTNEIAKKSRALRQEARKKVMEILTDEQKKELNKGRKRGKGKKKKKKAKAAA